MQRCAGRLGISSASQGSVEIVEAIGQRRKPFSRLPIAGRQVEQRLQAVAVQPPADLSADDL